MEIISSKEVKARKQHVCQLCACKIEIGETYNTQFNKQDGDTYTFKNHIHCQEIAGVLKMYDYCDYGLNDETFQETIRNEFYSIADEYIEAPSFKNQLEYVCSFNNVKIL